MKMTLEQQETIASLEKAEFSKALAAIHGEEVQSNLLESFAKEIGMTTNQLVKEMWREAEEERLQQENNIPDEVAEIDMAFADLEIRVKNAKPNDRSELDRYYAILLTELEKASAYFGIYILNWHEYVR